MSVQPLISESVSQLSVSDLVIQSDGQSVVSK